MEGTKGGIMPIRKESGFSMLEVLISFIIIMFGILGISGIQMLSVDNTANGRYQSFATMLASSMAAKMRANPSYWGSPSSSITITSTAVTGIASSTTDCTQTVCSDVEMAYFDLDHWRQDLTAGAGTMMLPSPPSGTAIATIDCPLASPMVCKITVNWSENNVALGNNSTGGATSMLTSGTSQNHTYTTLVSII
jgi:type IV pilus assembly protein PilV